MARVKLHLFLFHLKFVKMKMFFTILALKQSNSVKRIFAVYKYSRRLLKRTLWPKFLSNNLSLWLFYDWLTFSQNLIFSNLILHNFILVSKSNSSVSKLFIFIRIRCVLNLHPNLRQYQIHNVVQNSESQPKDLYFSKGIFSGLIFWAAYNRTVDFQMWRLRNELVKEFGELVLTIKSYYFRYSQQKEVTTFFSDNKKIIKLRMKYKIFFKLQ